MVNLIKTIYQLIMTSIYGLITKILSIFLSNWLDNYINHNISNFTGLVVNASLNFVMMKHIFEVDGISSTNFIVKYTITTVMSIFMAQLLYMIFAYYMQHKYKKWVKNYWTKYIFWIRYIIGSITYGFFEFPLQKFWVFRNL